MSAKNSNFVYSTNPDWQPENESTRSADQRKVSVGQVVKIQREKKGRGGKTVTVISGLSGDLKSLKKDLQKHCGTGGALKNGLIEIQGDHGPKLRDFLESMGYRAKLAGGY